MRKSILKRFKITKKGKFIKRTAGQNHFRAKKSGDAIRKKRKKTILDKSLTKKIKEMISFISI